LSVEYKLGATRLDNGAYQFRVWAPAVDRVDVHFVAPDERVERLQRDRGGYHHGVLEGVGPGARYFYRLDGTDRPDPASRFQPEGVHGPSEVVDPDAYAWHDAAWPGVARHDLVIYELHVGTFTAEGTFDSVIAHLDDLVDLGITAIELLPVNAFPGNWNWGYDGVLPFAVQVSYGGPAGLRRLVDACHQRGLAVILDIVYNHLGPEGNYLGEFGPYFTNQHLTPWGTALNYDGNDSDHVREFFIQNGLYWLSEYHLDGFRLDAIHAIYDQTAKPFLEEWTTAVRQQGREMGIDPVIIAESMMNDPKVILPPALGGFDMDAEWNDDFHHALHVLLTGERDGYYADYSGISDLAKAYRQGYVYTGQYMGYRGRRHGRPAHNTEPWQFLAYTQTHDQVGNHGGCARLSQLTDVTGLKLAAAAVLLSPFTPMLFMGEEYGETNPWWYFIDHGDPDLREAVRAGRRNEFAGFNWDGEMVDPASEQAFMQSKLQHKLKEDAVHAELLEWYRSLLRLRREIPSLGTGSFEQQEVFVYQPENLMIVHRWKHRDTVVFAFAFGDDDVTVDTPVPHGRWQKLLESTRAGNEFPDTVQSGGKIQLTFARQSFVLYQRATKET
jgi:maltooligosyltrehalose trehalohydrolase